MSEVHLTKSPLREAVIDFKFNFLEEVDISKLEAAHEQIKDAYPIKEVMDVNSLMFDIKVGNTPKFEHTQGRAGFRFLNETKDIVIQFRVDGFTFSKIKPYTSWEEVLELAKSAYTLYLQTVSVDKITRIATRYINFIEIEENEIVDIKKYFHIYPSIPESIDSPFENYLMRIALRNTEINAVALINQGLVFEPQLDGKVKRSLLMDIDCYKENQTISTDNPWDSLIEIKTYTNEIFFSGITDFTKDKFK